MRPHPPHPCRSAAHQEETHDHRHRRVRARGRPRPTAAAGPAGLGAPGWRQPLRVLAGVVGGPLVAGRREASRVPTRSPTPASGRTCSSRRRARPQISCTPVSSDSGARQLEGPVPHLVLSYVEGPSLETLREESVLTVPDVVLLGVQLASSLRHLHRHRLVHLDVKPGNVVVRNGRAVLLDLGATTPAGRVYGRHDAPGTTSYMPPELLGHRRRDVCLRRLRPRGHAARAARGGTGPASRRRAARPDDGGGCARTGPATTRSCAPSTASWPAPVPPSGPPGPAALLHPCLSLGAGALANLGRVRIWRSLDDVPADLGRTVVVIGNFDGVHQGHRHVATSARGSSPTQPRPSSSSRSPSTPTRWRCCGRSTRR